jgi:hypothetical protein
MKKHRIEKVNTFATSPEQAREQINILSRSYNTTASRIGIGGIVPTVLTGNRELRWDVDEIYQIFDVNGTGRVISFYVDNNVPAGSAFRVQVSNLPVGANVEVNNDIFTNTDFTPISLALEVVWNGSEWVNFDSHEL